MAPLKLYCHPISSNSRCVLLTLKNLGLEAEIITVDVLKNEQFAPEFAKINPHHTLPTLDDDGFLLWESRVISTYIISAKAPESSLYPTDPKKRAIVDARLYFNQSLQIAMQGITLPIRDENVTTIPKDRIAKVYKVLGEMNVMLEGKSYAAGNELSVADLALLSTVSTIKALGGNISKFSNVSAWYKRLESIPGFQENEEGAQALGDYLKSTIKVTGTWDD